MKGSAKIIPPTNNSREPTTFRISGGHVAVEVAYRKLSQAADLLRETVQTCARVRVEEACVGLIIGKGGETIRSIISESKCAHIVGPRGADDAPVFAVHGSVASVGRAVGIIRARVEGVQRTALLRFLTTRDYFEMLGVIRSATTDEIRAAYRQLLPSVHPDRRPFPEATVAYHNVLTAYRCLKDPEKRIQLKGMPFGRAFFAKEVDKLQILVPLNGEQTAELLENSKAKLREFLAGSKCDVLLRDLHEHAASNDPDAPLVTTATLEIRAMEFFDIEKMMREVSEWMESVDRQAEKIVYESKRVPFGFVDHYRDALQRAEVRYGVKIDWSGGERQVVITGCKPAVKRAMVVLVDLIDFFERNAKAKESKKQQRQQKKTQPRSGAGWREQRFYRPQPSYFAHSDEEDNNEEDDKDDYENQASSEEEGETSFPFGAGFSFGRGGAGFDPFGRGGPFARSRFGRRGGGFSYTSSSSSRGGKQHQSTPSSSSGPPPPPPPPKSRPSPFMRTPPRPPPEVQKTTTPPWTPTNTEEKALYDDAQKILKLKDHWEVLGLKRGCTGAELRQAFFRLAKVYHPDKCTVPVAKETFQHVYNSFTTIKTAFPSL